MHDPGSILRTEIPIESKTHGVLKKMQCLEILWQNNIICKEDLKPYHDSFDMNISYPNWFLRLYLDNTEFKLKLINNLSHSNEFKIDEIEKHCSSLAEKDYSQMIEFLKVNLQELNALNLNQNLKNHLQKLGNHSVRLLQKNASKGQAVFAIFLEVKFLMTHSSEPKLELFQQIISNHQSTIEKQEGIKKILKKIYDFIVKRIPQFEKINFFKPLTQSENIIESIKENIPPGSEIPSNLVTKKTPGNSR